MVQAAAPQGYVLAAPEGEHLIHFRDQGNILIKVDPVKGSGIFALGTQRLPVGAGIPVHRHLQMDEAFYVLEGSGAFTLNDVRHPIEKGATIFIPKNAWHGFSTADQELLLLWVMAPPGLDGFFVRLAVHPAHRQSSWLRSRSTRLPANMERSSDESARSAHEADPDTGPPQV